MDIAAVSTAMSAAATQQAVSIAVQKNVQGFTEQIASELIAMLDVGSSPHQVDIEV